MNPLAFATLGFGAMLGAGVIENSNSLVLAGGCGMGALQVWTMLMLQPIRDKIAKLETKIAVIEARCGAHYGSQYQHKTPNPLDDTPV